jgi:NAD(P)-dependent dehydrogenase (short-subunit alcohol dehydrogenase family)
VNNAGILRDRTLLKMTADEWDAVIKVHLRGHYAPTHAAVRYWRQEGRPDGSSAPRPRAGSSATSGRATTARPRPGSPPSRRSSRRRTGSTASP